ncbi:hypothetical protein [Paraburkholderia piptadeniae]|nr:hypothetical protein [Paraburkholderia piptadeniae]
MKKMLDCASGLEHEALIGSVARALRNLLEKQSLKNQTFDTKPDEAGD